MNAISIKNDKEAYWTALNAGRALQLAQMFAQDQQFDNAMAYLKVYREDMRDLTIDGYFDYLIWDWREKRYSEAFQKGRQQAKQTGILKRENIKHDEKTTSIQ